MFFKENLELLLDICRVIASRVEETTADLELHVEMESIACNLKESYE